MIEMKITAPEGMEIDKVNSTFECIKFKPIEQPKRRRDDGTQKVKGYYITPSSHMSTCESINNPFNYNIFVTEKQAKSALAMARISQIMANDKRFGGVVTEEEWKHDNMKYTIERMNSQIFKTVCCKRWVFLAFHTEEQRDLFLKENEDLVKDCLML